MISEHSILITLGCRVKTVETLWRRYRPLKMGQRCLLSGTSFTLQFWVCPLLLTSISHSKPYKLSLYSWQLHYSFWVCGPITFSCIISTSQQQWHHSSSLTNVNSFFFYNSNQKSSLNYDIFVHLTFCFSSLSPFFILVYRENWHFWSVLKQSCCFSYLLITIWGLQRQYLHLKSRAGIAFIFTLYK